MFEQLAQTVAQRLQAALPAPGVVPGKVSVWLRFVRHVPQPAGAPAEETVGTTTRVFFTALAAAELYEQVAQNVLLKVYGEEIQTVTALPNLILRVEDRKVRVAMPGAPPLDQPGQIFLKVTVFAWRPGLWERLFGRGEAGQP